MRPAGEIRQALRAAALALAEPARSPTMFELAATAQVGFASARRTIDNMRRAGELTIVRERRVDYRNRPVAEYAVAAFQPHERGDAGELAGCWFTQDA